MLVYRRWHARGECANKAKPAIYAMAINRPPPSLAYDTITLNSSLGTVPYLPIFYPNSYKELRLLYDAAVALYGNINSNNNHRWEPPPLFIFITSDH